MSNLLRQEQQSDLFPTHIYMVRIDGTDNLYGFYALTIESGIFGERCMVRSWGRIDTRGQEKCHSFERAGEVHDLSLTLALQKRPRGNHGPCDVTKDNDTV